MTTPCNKNITKLKNNYYITALITVYQTYPNTFSNTKSRKRKIVQGKLALIQLMCPIPI